MPELFTLYFDGASKGNPGPAGAGAVIESNSHAAREIKQYLGIATNNQAEYSALLLGLEAALELEAKEVQVFSDSELVVRQLNGEYQIKDEKLKELYLRVIKLSSSFQKVKYTHIPREKNKHADSLANQAVREANQESLPAPQSVGEAWLELRIGADSLMPAAKRFIQEVLEKVQLPNAKEPGASIMTAIDKAFKELKGTGNGICIRFFCDDEIAHVELDAESRRQLIYQHFKIPKSNQRTAG